MRKWKWKSLSHIRLFATPRTIQSMELSRLEYWSVDIAFPFSSGSSQPRDQSQVSCIAGGFFYQLSHKGSTRILKWVACPFSIGSSNPGIELQIPNHYIVYLSVCLFMCVYTGKDRLIYCRDLAYIVKGFGKSEINLATWWIKSWSYSLKSKGRLEAEFLHPWGNLSLFF